MRAKFIRDYYPYMRWFAILRAPGLVVFGLFGRWFVSLEAPDA